MSNAFIFNEVKVDLRPPAAPSSTGLSGSSVCIIREGTGRFRSVTGKEAGFGISVKINSRRAYSGVNSIETISLGAPLLD